MKTVRGEMKCDLCNAHFPFENPRKAIKIWLHTPCPACGKGEILEDRHVYVMWLWWAAGISAWVFEILFYIAQPWRLFWNKPKRVTLHGEFNAVTGTHKTEIRP